MAPGPSFDADGIEERLRTLPEVELLGLLRHSSNYTFLARLCEEGDGPQDGMLAVYKPARGERPLWDFPGGSLYAREVASYLVAKALGWPHVPPTVVRERAPHGVGALQWFVAARSELHYLVAERTSVPEGRWMEIAAFDVLVNNADRKSGHCLIDEHADVWVIDHGLTFHVEDKLRTVIWDFAGRRLPEPMREDVARVAAQLDVADGALAVALAGLVDEDELAMFRRRLRVMADRRWRFPGPTSSWAVPWPPV
jgi:hypothetical protein